MKRFLPVVIAFPLLLAAAPLPRPTPDPFLAIERATARLVLDKQAAQKIIQADQNALMLAEERAASRSVGTIPKTKR